MVKYTIYKKYKKATNMPCNVMKKWKSNPLSKKASLNREPIDRNVMLQCTPFSKWGNKQVVEAKKAISYLARAKKIKGCKRKNSLGGYCKNEIALKNWAYDRRQANH